MACQNSSSIKSYGILKSAIFGSNTGSPSGISHLLPQFFSPNFEHFLNCLFVHICLKLIVASHFRLRCQRSLYFSPNLENFIIVRFLSNLCCAFHSQFSILHFYPKLVVALHFWIRRQKALYLSPNFEHITIVRCWWN